MDRLALRQSGGTDHAGFDSIRVKKGVFLLTVIRPVIWTMIALSFCFLPLRFYTRWRAFRRLFWDDFLTVFAWLLAVSIGAIATYIGDSMYFIMYLSLGLIPTSAIPPNIMDLVKRMARGSVVSYMIMYTCLWCIKLGFLLFFYRLGVKTIRNLRWHWWSVLAFTVLCYFGCFPSLPYYCSFGDDEAMQSDYCFAEQNLSFISMKVNCALDVLTDVLIMTIPFNILWRSRVNAGQKAALAGVFSLVLITIITAIVRATVTTTGVSKQMDVAWVLVWTSVEANIAIIVACVGSFRMLFVQHRKESRPSRDSFQMMERDGDKRSSRKTPREVGNSAWTCDEIIVEGRWFEGGAESPTPIIEVVKDMNRIEKV